MIDLSVVIPAYNEQFRLPSTLASVHTYLQSLPSLSFEIIVVNDGSKDETVQEVENFANHHEYIRLISYPINKGKGFAVKTGVMAACGNQILIDDADGSSPIEELSRLQEMMLKGFDIVIGSRAKLDPTITIKALAYRTYLGNIFNGIVQSVLLPGIYDTQCGFKLFKAAAAKDIFSVSSIGGYGFDVEILYIAKQRNYTIEEVAINWTNIEGSKINLLTDPLKMLTEVLKIRIKSQLHHYDKATKIHVNDQS